MYFSFHFHCVGCFTYLLSREEKKKSTQNLLKIDMLSRIYACYRLSIPSQMTMVYHRTMRSLYVAQANFAADAIVFVVAHRLGTQQRLPCFALLCFAQLFALFCFFALLFSALLYYTLLCSARLHHCLVLFIQIQFRRSSVVQSAAIELCEKDSMCVCVCDVLFLLTFFRCFR